MKLDLRESKMTKEILDREIYECVIKSVMGKIHIYTRVVLVFLWGWETVQSWVLNNKDIIGIVINSGAFVLTLLILNISFKKLNSDWYVKNCRNREMRSDTCIFEEDYIGWNQISKYKYSKLKMFKITDTALVIHLGWSVMALPRDCITSEELSEIEELLQHKLKK